MKKKNSSPCRERQGLLSETGSDPGDAAFACGQGGCRGYGIPDARVKGLGKNIVGTELVLGNKGGEGVRRGELHRVVDVRGTHVQRPAENAGEAEHVVEMSEARTSSAPRKMPGKQSTLLTWFG